MAGVASPCGVSPGCINRRRRPGEAGFTLVELSVTVAVIGILAAIAIPSFKGLMPKIRLGNATQTLANELAMSRMAAIAKSTEFAIRFDAGGNSYALFQYTDDPATSAVDYAWRQNSSASLGSSLEIESFKYADGSAVPATGTPPTITLQLNANGTTDVPFHQKSMRIVLQTSDGTLKKRVVVGSTGRIFSQRWIGGDVDDEATWVEE